MRIRRSFVTGQSPTFGYISSKTKLEVASISEQKGLLNQGEIESPVSGNPIILSTNAQLTEILNKLANAPIKLGSVSYTGRGIGAYHRSKHSKEIIENKAFHSDHKVDASYRPELRGESIGRYSIDWDEANWISYGDWLSEPREPVFFRGPRVFCRKIIGHQLICTFTAEEWLVNQQVYIACNFQDYDARAVTAMVSSNLIGFFARKLHNEEGAFPHLRVDQFRDLPLPEIDFVTSTKERQRLAGQITGEYIGINHTGALEKVQLALTAGQSDVVHDVLAHLAQTMIDLNKQKQAEVQRFLGWLEGQLNIAPRKGKTGLSALAGYTIIQNYLGDYQKGEPALPWSEMEYRLHQNRSRYAANLAEVKGRIQAEYEQSLATLRPIKEQLAATDALIDKIVYQLYGLSDEEIALIEQPAYEQAFTAAKEKVRDNEKLQKDPDAAMDAMAETVRPAAERLQSRVNVAPEEARLDADLPGWRLFGGDVPTFLRTGEYAIDHFPDHMDFSASVVQYAKAVEQAIMQRLFEPFRAAGHGPGDCKNKFLQKFVQGKKHLTLGSFPYILTSKERALAAFAERQYPGRGRDVFFDKTNGVRALLMDQAHVDLRNAAAHSEALTKADAKQAREWAIRILRYL